MATRRKKLPNVRHVQFWESNRLAEGHPPDRATGRENCRTVSVRSAGRPISEGSAKVGKDVERKHKCLLKLDLAQCPYCIELHVKQRVRPEQMIRC